MKQFSLVLKNKTKKSRVCCLNATIFKKKKEKEEELHKVTKAYVIKELKSSDLKIGPK